MPGGCVSHALLLGFLDHMLCSWSCVGEVCLEKVSIKLLEYKVRKLYKLNCILLPEAKYLVGNLKIASHCVSNWKSPSRERDTEINCISIPSAACRCNLFIHTRPLIFLCLLLLPSPIELINIHLSISFPKAILD